MEDMVNKKISVAITVYNESEILAKTISEFLEFLEKKNYDYTFWIFDNNSNDGSQEIIDTFTKNNRVKHFKHDTNKGYGYNNFSALKIPKADIYFIIDGDGQYSPHDIERFLNKLETCDLIIGYRKIRKDPIIRLLMSKIFNLFARIIIKTDIKDINCGFKALNHKLADHLKIKYFYNYINPELFAYCKKNNFIVKDLSVEHFSRPKGKSYFSGIVHIIKNVLLMIKYLIQVRKEYL
jgi:glycosyltransferase involved in cell wall biosynthesis